MTGVYPLIFAALAGLYSERAGIVDIGLEGKILAWLCCSAGARYLDPLWVGFVFWYYAVCFLAMVSTALPMLLHNRGDHIRLRCSD